MRIGILTASRSDNNGTDLLALAMQRLFISRGFEAELIDYRCPKLENSRRIFYPHSLKGLLSIPYRMFDHAARLRFRRKHFKSSSAHYTEKELSHLDYDAVVVGSDQIWNLSITGSDMGFFLPYESDKPAKYSYAASLGRTDISEWNEKYALREKLERFRYVSVRESSAVEALSQIGITARHDLDPILMLKREDWLEYIKPVKASRPYIAVYAVGGLKKAVDAVRNYAKNNKLDICVIGDPIKPIPGVKVKRFVDMTFWLGLIVGAQLVVTDSYHCLAFTLLFERPFVRMPLENVQSEARLTDLIDLLNIDSAVKGSPVFPQYKDVSARLEELRKISFAYLGSIMGDDSK